MTSALRVLLADDHALVRAGLRLIVERFPATEVCGEAGDGHEALRLIDVKRPHVVLMDISLPGLNGLEVAARITKDEPSVRVIMVSMHVSEQHVRQAFRAGAVGYLAKESTVAELELALRAVTQGQTYLSAAISRGVVDRYLDPSSEERPGPALTPRQREIVQLIAEGHSTKEIASRLGLSIKTIETHRAQLMERLHIYDVAGLVRFAIRTGLVSAEC
jgi:DNA-binding NarL/FixJ family response regulator